MQEKYRVLFEPGRIAGVSLKNRFYMAPIGPSGMCAAKELRWSSESELTRV